MGNKQSNQFGGVAAFIIVGVVLAALLGGGIYLSKQWGRNARLADAPTTEQQVPNTDDQTDENPGPEPEQPPATDTTDENEDQQPAPSQNQDDTSGDSSSDTPVPATGPTHIAETGPSDMIAPLAGLSLGTAGIIAYRRSRSQLVRSALK